MAVHPSVGLALVLVALVGLGCASSERREVSTEARVASLERERASALRSDGRDSRRVRQIDAEIRRLRRHADAARRRDGDRPTSVAVETVERNREVAYLDDVEVRLYLSPVDPDDWTLHALERAVRELRRSVDELLRDVRALERREDD